MVKKATKSLQRLLGWKVVHGEVEGDGEEGKVELL